MFGDLTRKGIGWYLDYEEYQKKFEQQDHRPGDGPWMLGNVNPGTIIGFGIGAAYVAWPIDIIPDWVPYVGYLDDAVILSGMTNFGTWLWDVFD